MNRRHLLWGAACIPLVSARAFAQSMDIQTPPEQRDLTGLRMEDWWDMRDTRMTPHPLPGQLHWYEEDCCSGEDCRAFDPELVREHTDGSVTLILPAISNTFPGMHVTFTKEIVKDRPKGAHQDKDWHLCFTIAFDIKEFEIRYHSFPLCAYPPSPSV